MAEDPGRADPRDALEIDHDDLASRAQRPLERGQGLRGKLEVMVGVADEGQVDRVRRQFEGVGLADDTDDVRDPLHLARPVNVLDEGGRDVHGVDLALWTDLRREQAREEAGAGADVRHDHARFEPAGGQDLLPLGVDLAAFNFEGFDEAGDIGGFKGLVDSRANALLLGPEPWRKSEEHRTAQTRKKGHALHHGPPRSYAV
jgi:hypothetical protein